MELFQKRAKGVPLDFFGGPDFYLFGVVRPVKVQSIAEPRPRLPQHQPSGLSPASIAARYGALSVEISNLIVLDMEYWKSKKGWEIRDALRAAMRPIEGGEVEVIAHRYYRLDGEAQEVALSSASSRGQVWSKDEVIFWQQTLRGRVL